MKNNALLSHADRLKEKLNSRHVFACVLNGDPAADDIFADTAKGGFERVLVYPLFMSDGYFVDHILPGRISEAGLDAITKTLSPLGLDPELPDLVMKQALEVARQADLSSETATLLLVGHGSKFGRSSAQSTERMAENLKSIGSFPKVETAYLEEAPFLHDILAAKKEPLVVVGYFAGDGMHAHEDVPIAIDETGANAVYTGPVGIHPSVVDLISVKVNDYLQTAD